MGQSAQPVTIRYGSSQMWEFNWLGSSHTVHYPYTIKLFRLFSRLIQVFFLYQIYIKNSLFFYADILNWKKNFINLFLLKFKKKFKKHLHTFILQTFIYKNTLRFYPLFKTFKSPNKGFRRFKKLKLSRSKKKRKLKLNDILRQSRLAYAPLQLKQYLIPVFFYQSRYFNALSSIKNKIFKQATLNFSHYKLRQASPRFLYPQETSLVGGRVFFFRYKNWILFVWCYILTNIFKKKINKFKYRSKKKVKKLVIIDLNRNYLKIKKVKKKFIRSYNMLENLKSTVFLF